ncbi:hypothetical protein [Streptomyces sp. NPDC051776]|uniref:hypothetical protein n=1 Tax=Streptomyces sp. NPDC051776 TaxID=3155414 RepID=UPI0034346C44
MTDRRQVKAGIARLEGYLLGQQQLGIAQREAEAFASRLPWLTTSQHEEIVRLYREERIALTRHTYRTIIARSEELKKAYTKRYLTLQRKLLCLYITLTLAVAMAWWGTANMRQ